MDHSQQAVSVFNKWANEYQEKFMDVTLYAQPLDFFCASLPGVAPQILDLACGPGNVAKYILDKYPGFRLYGTDLSENMITLARHNNPTAEFDVMDARAVATINRMFDGIMISFLIPYLNYDETDELLHNCCTVLQKNGLTYLSAIEGEYHTSGPQRGSKGDLVFQHFYTAEDLRTLFQKHHLSVLSIQQLKSVMSNGTTVTDLVIVGKKST